VRCAWENTTQGVLKAPISEFVRLTLDGRETKPELVAKEARNNMHSEHHYLLALPELAAGKHTATAVVREIASGRESTRTIEFTA
jgi:hypothetical protein